MRWTVAWMGLVALASSGASYAQESVSWVDPVGVSVSGQTVSKVAPPGWNASAISRQTLGAGDGFVEFETLETNTLKAAGLSRHSIVGTFEDVDFGIRLNPDATFDIVEDGNLTHPGGLFYLGDRFKIAIVGTTVVYSRNGSFVYQSATTPTTRLQFLVALHTSGATITNSVAGGLLLEGVVWTAHQDTVSRGNDLQKFIPGTNNPVGAISTRGIVGNGRLELVVPVGSQKTVGLSNGDSNVLESDIDFGFRIVNYALSVVENGVVRGAFGTAVETDVLQISVEANTVKYLRNNVLLYSSLATPNFPLLVDTSLVGRAARVRDTTLSGSLADIAAAPPSLSVASGSYPAPLSVLVGGPPGALLRYTVNGADPGSEDATVASGASIAIPVDSVLKVRAWGAGLLPSGVTKATYVIGTPQTEAVAWSGLVNTASGPVGLVKVGGAPASWDAHAYSSRSLRSPNGFAEVVVADLVGGWGWGLSASDGSTQPGGIDYSVVMSGGSLSFVEQQATFGSHTIAVGDVVGIGLEGGCVVYRINGRRVYVSRSVPSLPLVVHSSIAGFGAVVRPSTITDVLGTTAVSPLAATPVGGAFDGPQLVSLTTPTTGAQIRYNLDGTDNYPLIYGGPISLPSSTLLRAKAVKAGLFSSEPYSGYYAIAAPPTTELVQWAAAVNAASVALGALSYSAQTDWLWAGAVSSKAISGGDGYVEAQFSSLGLEMFLGLSKGDTDQTDVDIDFAIKPTAAGVAIYERGLSVGTFGVPGTAGDVLRIGIENGVVKYRQNGVLIYVSPVPPQYPVLVDTSLAVRGTALLNVVLSGVLSQHAVANVTASVAPGHYPTTRSVTLSTSTPGATIRYTLDGTEPSASSAAYSAPISIATSRWLNASAFKSGLAAGPTFSGYYAIGAPATTEGVLWLNQVNVSSLSAGNLRHSGPAEVVEAGAISSRALQAGDGWVEALWTGLDASLYLGLSKGESNRTPADIDYAVHLASGGLAIWERGFFRGTYGQPANLGDLVRIAVEAGAIKYRQNGVLVYSSVVAPQFPLLVDTSQGGLK